MDSLTCLLPGGYIDDVGVVHRQAVLVPLSGREEELLATHDRRAYAPLVTAVISQCVQRLGRIHSVTEDIVRDLLVADRQYLLLKLREVTFGEQIQPTIGCPQADCRKKIDIDFSLRNIPVEEAVDRRSVYTMQLSPQAAFIYDDAEPQQNVTFRLPNGSDQEILSPFLSRDEEEISVMLLKRCIKSLGNRSHPADEDIARLSPLARMEIEQQMEALAPQVILMMQGDCPECGHAFAVPFDLEGFVFSELYISCDLLYREIHYLAYHYHWSEREIMEMPQAKRRRYIEVLAEEMEGINDAI